MAAFRFRRTAKQQLVECMSVAKHQARKFFGKREHDLKVVVGWGATQPTQLFRFQNTPDPPRGLTASLGHSFLILVSGNANVPDDLMPFVEQR